MSLEQKGYWGGTRLCRASPGRASEARLWGHKLQPLHPGGCSCLTVAEVLPCTLKSGFQTAGVTVTELESTAHTSLRLSLASQAIPGTRRPNSLCLNLEDLVRSNSAYVNKTYLHRWF